MNVREAIYRLLCMKGVSHTTLNPYGPGTVRIHLVPPKFSLKGASPSVAILNGKDIIPIGMSWAILLNAFIEEVNFYEGNEITEDEMEVIILKTLEKVKKVYPRTKDSKMRDDLLRIVRTLMDVAYGNEPSENIGFMTLGEYVPFMAAPHRILWLVLWLEKGNGIATRNVCIAMLLVKSKQKLRSFLLKSGKALLISAKKLAYRSLLLQVANPLCVMICPSLSNMQNGL